MTYTDIGARAAVVILCSDGLVWANTQHAIAAVLRVSAAPEHANYTTALIKEVIHTVRFILGDAPPAYHNTFTTVALIHLDYALFDPTYGGALTVEAVERRLKMRKEQGLHNPVPGLWTIHYHRKGVQGYVPN